MNIKISQVINAGILIENSNTKILIDGIHNDGSTVFNTIDEGLMLEIIYGKRRYHNINYLLFSHQHSDHFNKEKTLEYVKNNKINMLMVCNFDEPELVKNGTLLELNTDYFEIGAINFDDISIKYFKTKHLDEENFGTNHYSFIISIENKNILFVGDSDYNKNELKEPLRNYKIDIVIAPFLISTYDSGRMLLKNISPDLVILNHLPNENHANINCRNITEKAINKHLTIIPKICIFQELNDYITV